MLLTIIILVLAAVGLAAALSKARFTAKTQALEIQRLEKERDEAIADMESEELFISNLCHEVRTPLNAVTGFAQLLSLPPESVTETERREYAEHVLNNSNLLIMLVNDILNISDIKAGNYSIKKSSQSLNALCHVALAAVQYRLENNVALRYETEVPDDYHLICDPRRVQQILINFLTNAIKHTSQGSIVLASSVNEVPGMVTFSVTDTGTGIPEEKMQHLFKRFSKLDSSIEGVGLGLNICHTLAEKMHGRVYLDENYKSGARFVFCLPIT